MELKLVVKEKKSGEGHSYMQVWLTSGKETTTENEALYARCISEAVTQTCKHLGRARTGREGHHIDTSTMDGKPLNGPDAGN